MATDQELISQSADRISEFRLPRWKELPDLDIYMDQLLSLISKYFLKYPGCEEKALTSSMVNNYVKQGIMPAPVRKKYNRTHVASLIAINLLKNAIPVARVGELITASLESSEKIDVIYDAFCDNFEKICLSAADTALDIAKKGGSISQSITMAALMSSAQQSLAMDFIKSKE